MATGLYEAVATISLFKSSIFSTFCDNYSSLHSNERVYNIKLLQITPLGTSYSKTNRHCGHIKIQDLFQFRLTVFYCLQITEVMLMIDRATQRHRGNLRFIQAHLNKIKTVDSAV